MTTDRVRDERTGSGKRMESKIRVTYTLTGEGLQPDAVTNAVTVTPSRSWSKGERRIPESPLLHNHGGWQISSGLTESAELAEHVSVVLGKLRPSWESFCEFGKSYDAELSCVIKSYGGDRPVIGFSKRVIAELNELDAEIDIDLYVFDFD